MLGANIFYSGIDSRSIVNFTECSVNVGFLRILLMYMYTKDLYILYQHMPLRCPIFLNLPSAR